MRIVVVLGISWLDAVGSNVARRHSRQVKPEGLKYE